MYVSDLVDYILDISTQYDWVNDPSEKLNIYRMVEAKFGDVYSGAQAATKARLDARIEAVKHLKKENKFGFEQLNLVVEYQDGSNSGVIPFRKHWNKCYDAFLITANDYIKELQAERQRLSKKGDK